MSLAPPTPEPQQAPKVYIRWLNIQPLRLHLSCRSVAGGRGFEDILFAVPAEAVGILTTVGAILTNIDRAPLRLKALVLDNIFTSPAMTRLRKSASASL